MKRFDFSGIQRLGRALMLPIAVLPAAALLLRFGQGDLLNLPFMAAAGAAIFDNLGLLFAVGIAVGLAKENQGAAGLAGAVGYFVLIKGAGALLAVPPDIAAVGNSAAWLMKEASRMSIPAGILSGLTAGALYNRYYAIRLPDYLSFFGGRRFVPIITGLACLGWAVLFGEAWPALASGLDGLSTLLSDAGDAGLFVYGVLNRLLIITGLHHIINNVVWFLHGSFTVAQDGVATVVTGDLNRFFAGDPAAGAFMSGFFPVMMFGLPGACLAMYRNALPGKRRAAGGLLLSMALTSFLTGITEPVEFAFMFLAPALYALHALLTGAALVVMNVFGVKLGFGFSAGFIDYVINYGISTEPLLLLPVGLAYFALYYCLFSVVIRRFDLKTLGREEGGARPETAVREPAGRAEPQGMLAALGGPGNLLAVDFTDTRLRLTLADAAAIDRQRLREEGALGFAAGAGGALDIVIGPGAGRVAASLAASLSASSGTSPGMPHGVSSGAFSVAPIASGKGRLTEGAASPGKGVGGNAFVTPSFVTATSMPSASGRDISDAARAARTDGAAQDSEAERLIAALGGPANITSVDACATRLRLTVDTDAAVDEKALAATGALGVVRPGPGSVQVVLGPRADVVSTELRDALKRRSRSEQASGQTTGQTISQAGDGSAGSGS